MNVTATLHIINQLPNSEKIITNVEMSRFIFLKNKIRHHSLTSQELKEYKALSAKVKCFIEAGKEELIK